MAIAHFGKVVISYPTEDQCGQTAPVVSMAREGRSKVIITIKTPASRPTLVISLQQEGQTLPKPLTLTTKQVALMHRHTQERRLVGLLQPHYAYTVLRWIKDGLLELEDSATGSEFQLTG